MKLTTSIYQVTFLIVLFAAFTGYTFMFASAPANPPANNADAPITVGAVDQIKNAGLSVDSLLVSGNMLVAGTRATFNQVRAAQYCDKSGADCFTSAAVSSVPALSCITRSSGKCLSDEVVTGGGCTDSCAGLRPGDCTAKAVVSSGPSGSNGWSCSTANRTIVSAVCCKVQ